MVHRSCRTLGPTTKVRLGTQRTMKITSLVLYGAVTISIVGAFFAGRYIGTTDADQRYAQTTRVQAASTRSDILYIAGSLAELLRAGKSTDALRIVEQYARLQVPSVSECLNEPSCAFWAAASEDRRTRMKERTSQRPLRALWPAAHVKR